MSSVGYCFNICRSVDKKITEERRASMCNPVPANIPTNTGALIFGRRFSFGNLTLPNTNSSIQELDNASSDKCGQ
jgi:hypothetical protein